MLETCRPREEPDRLHVSQLEIVLERKSNAVSKRQKRLIVSVQMEHTPHSSFLRARHFDCFYECLVFSYSNTRYSFTK